MERLYNGLKMAFVLLVLIMLTAVGFALLFFLLTFIATGEFFSEAWASRAIRESFLDGGWLTLIRIVCVVTVLGFIGGLFEKPERPDKNNGVDSVKKVIQGQKQ